VEQPKPHAHADTFAEQFISVLDQRWSNILLFVHRQSPHLALLLRSAPPADLKRIEGTWHICIKAGRLEKLHQPRDNEIVAQAIRLWAYSAAHLKLPNVAVDFEP
jgi:transposase